MKRNNKFVKSICVAALSSCLLAGGLLISNYATDPKGISPSNAYSTISNNVPSFVKTDNISDTFSFVDYISDEFASISFDTATDDNVDENKLQGTYYDGSKYLAFDINNITTTLNGNIVEGGIDYSEAIKRYYEEVAPGAEKQYPHGLNFFPESLDLNLSVNLDASEPTMEAKEGVGEPKNRLVLNEQGIVTVSVTYTQYELSTTTNAAGTTVLRTDNVISNQLVEYSFFLLDRNTYLELGTNDSPNITFDENIMTKTASGSTTYKFNYFYNYNSDKLPTIKYNATNYEITVLKAGSNNTYTTNLIKYNPSTQDISILDENGIEQQNESISAVLEGEMITLSFYDLGEYVLKYETIFVDGNKTYTVENPITNQKLYMFGYQSYYTLKSATYSELKIYDETKSSYTSPADITYLFENGDLVLNAGAINNDLLNGIFEANVFNREDTEHYIQDIATTNQTPVKFQTIDGLLPASSSYYYSGDGETWEEKDFSVAENHSAPGRYFFKLDYSFDSYTNESGVTNSEKDFTQYFAFEITKTTPSISVYSENEGTKANITDGAYTNDEVLITYEQYANIYNRAVTIELVKYDYNNKITSQENINWYNSGTLYTLKENGIISVTEDGNYTINIYQQDSSNPIVRKFNIDTNKNFNLSSYSVEQSKSTQNNYATTEIQVLSNQSLVFSWDNVKASGATTKGYYKYYPISANSLFNDEFLQTYLYYFVDKNVTPVEYKLNLSAETNWLQYTNFNYSVNASKIVSSMYIKSNAGLYVVQTQDEAGNTQTKIFIIDKSSPVFILHNLKANAEFTYQPLSQNNTITEDVGVIWGKYKVIYIPKNESGATSFYDVENLDSALYTNKSGEFDPQIYSSFQEILCGDGLTNPNEDANISFLSLPNLTSKYSSYYLCVEINDDVYFKNINVDDSGYTFISGEEYDYSYEIISSYKLYQFNNSKKLYRTITQADGAFVSVENSLGEIVREFNASNLTEIDIYIYYGNNYIIGYDKNGIRTYSRFDSLNNLVKEDVSVTTSDGDLYYSSYKLTKVDFVDKEGTYTFLLRDQSNTTGSTLNQKTQYLSYPSAYQYLKITGDQSQLRTYFINDDGREVELADSSFFTIGNKEVDGVEITEADGSVITQKSSYFSPTDEDVIYISFIPTISSGGTQIQVKEVSIQFYEFETSVYDYVSDAYYPTYQNYLVYNSYKSLKQVWATPVVIYSFEEDGAYEVDDDGNPETFVYELNVNEGKTKAGFYQITRSYMTDGNKEATDTNDYLVTSYDYKERILNAYIDRYDVITQSETITPTLTENNIRYKYEYIDNAIPKEGYYDYKFYANKDKVVYLPFKRVGTEQKLIAHDPNGNELDISSQISIKLSFIQGGLVTDTTISWGEICTKLSGKLLTDTNGQEYLVLDMSGNGLVYNGKTYTAYSTIDMRSSFTVGSTTYKDPVLSESEYKSTSTQSLVGGSMLVTMYSTYDSNGGIISVAHPSQTSNLMMLYNSGDSFYTREDTSNIPNLTSLFNTNKLPVSISIPKYKYATYFTKSVQTSTNGKIIVCNYVYETDLLSYYIQGDQNSSINSYELEVEVDYYADKIEDNKSPTKVYKSNGTLAQYTFVSGGVTTTKSSGYLALYEYNPSTDVYSALKKDFTDAGYYVVRITQAPNEVAGLYNFKSTYSFCFTIERNQPEFSLYAGTLLKNITNTDYYEESDKTALANQNTYFTNKDEISVVWTDSSSPYKANIDKGEIQFSIGGANANNGLYKLKLTQPASGEKIGTVAVQVYESGWIDLPELSTYFSYEYAENTMTNTLSFNLKELNVNVNNAHVTITMQLLGHNSVYYKTTSKTIYYDQTASYETLASLHSLLYSTSYGIALADIREYYLADGTTKTNDQSIASYNQTISSGTYAQYAFTVNLDFFDALKANIKANIDMGVYTATTSAYFREISYNSSYMPTTNTNDFIETEFTQITDKFENTLYADKYYEVVEKDLAGNITVYVIYVTTPNGTYIDDGYTYNNGITYDYVDSEGISNTTSVNEAQIESNKYNINSSSALKVKKVNHLGDSWNYFYTAIYNSNLGTYLYSYYLATPELEDGYVYRVTGVAVKEYTRVPLSEIFASSEGRYKNYVYILNKITGNYNSVAISISDTASLTIMTGETGTVASKSAFLSILLPTPALTNGNIVQAIPVSVSIKDKSNDEDVTIYPDSYAVVYNLDEYPNNPNNINNLNDENYSYLNKWLETSNSMVTVTYVNDTLLFTIPNVRSDTKLEYTIIDNFGNPTTEIYIVGETKVKEITSSGNIYTYYGQIENQVEYTYISSTDINVNYNTSKYIVQTTLLNQKTSGYGAAFVDASPGVIDLNNFKIENKDNLPFYITTSSANAINTMTFASSKSQYDILIRVDFYDRDNGIVGYPLKSYYIRLYKLLPNQGDIEGTENDYYLSFVNSNGGDDTNDLLREKTIYEEVEFVTIGGKRYSVYSSNQTFSDELKVSYSSPSELDFPYEVLYYSTNEDWGNGDAFVPLTSGSTLNLNGIYYILVRYTSQSVLTKEYHVFKIEILGSSGGFYYVLANGVRKEKASVYYTHNGTQYSDYYIVNISYSDRLIEEKFQIITNDYQNVKAFEVSPFIVEGTGIYTYSYILTNYTLDEYGTVPTNAREASEASFAPQTVGISPYKQTIYITFLSPSSDILSISNGTTSNLFYKTNDTSDLYVTSSTSAVNMFVYDETPDTNTMTISWFKYYGIEANLITATAEKDGQEVVLTIHETGNYYYVTLSRSGYYLFRFQDTAGNVQSFFSGQKSLPIVFIKDVHFTMVYENPITLETDETEVINKAVYNNSVKVKLNKLLIPYYQSSSFGNGNIINVYRNGEEYKNYEYSSEDYSFTFSETGYYQVSMTAYDKASGHKLRSETYTFTIINAKESRYAYEFSGYQNYYIKSVIKDGVDITNSLLKSLRTDSNYTTVNVQMQVGNSVSVVPKNYLKSLLISYFDEKTGGGKYQITICANDEVYAENSSSYTFELYINAQVVPLSVSLADGSTTNSEVTVSFNAKNVYEAVGECYIVVGNETYIINETTIDTVNLILGDNERRGTHFIQVYTMSGNLLFSHKITLTEPMNAWTIIAIVAGSIAVVLLIFVIVKLRKRMGVK